MSIKFIRRIAVICFCLMTFFVIDSHAQPEEKHRRGQKNRGQDGRVRPADPLEPGLLEHAGPPRLRPRPVVQAESDRADHADAPWREMPGHLRPSGRTRLSVDGGHARPLPYCLHRTRASS